MDAPQVEALPRPRRRLGPFAVALFIGLACVGLAAHHAPHRFPWQKSLDEFRDTGSADTGDGANWQMSDMITLRNDLRRSIWRGQTMRLSPKQVSQTTVCLNGPVDELSQSEALDALMLARRAGFLSPAQTQTATASCLSVLSRSPPPMVRLEGARFLSHTKDPRGVGALRLLLNDPVPKIRDAASQSLAQGR